MATLSFDKSQKLITVLAPDVSISVQELIDKIRDWEDELTSMDIQRVADAEGKVDLGGGLQVGITLKLLNGWKLKFSDRAGPTTELMEVNGGNILGFDTGLQTFYNPIEPSTFTMVTKDKAVSVAGIDSTSIGASVWDVSRSSHTIAGSFGEDLTLFANAVYLDPTSSNTGTAYPTGTVLEPVNNLADAKSIANNHGFTKIKVFDDITITNTDNVNDIILEGQKAKLVNVTVNSGASTINTTFINVKINGALDGIDRVINSEIDAITGFNGTIINSVINSSITLGGSKHTDILSCYSGIPGVSTPIIDMGGTGNSLSLRDYNGGIELQNKSGADSVSVDMSSGNIILNSNVTNGTLTLRGTASLTDNSVGATVITEGLTNPKTISDQVWIEQLTDHSGVTGSTAEALGNISAGASPSAIADAVWDEQLSGHTTVGSAGEALDSAGGGSSPATIAAAVWDKATADHTTAGTFGAAVSKVKNLIQTLFNLFWIK